MYEEDGSSKERRTYTLDEARVHQLTVTMNKQQKLEEDLEHLEAREQFSVLPYLPYTIREQYLKKKKERGKGKKLKKGQQQQEEEHHGGGKKESLGKRKPNRLKGVDGAKKTTTGGGAADKRAKHNVDSNEGNQTFRMKIETTRKGGKGGKGGKSKKKLQQQQQEEQQKRKQKSKRNQPRSYDRDRPDKRLNTILRDILVQSGAMLYRAFLKPGECIFWNFCFLLCIKKNIEKILMYTVLKLTYEIDFLFIVFFFCFFCQYKHNHS